MGSDPFSPESMNIKTRSLFIQFYGDKTMKRLWFLTDGVKLKGVYNSEKAVEREYKKYEDDPDFSYYDYYEVKLNDLDDYPDEYELAMDEGFIDF